MKVELQYFKESGKYYSSGEYETLKNDMYSIRNEVYSMFVRGRLPGLVDGARFHTYINVPNHPFNVPMLLILR